MSTLTRDGILAAKDRESEIVDVPEWGGSVRVSTLSGTDRAKYEGYLSKYQNREDGELPLEFKERLLIYALVDDSGNRLFGDDQIEEIGSKSHDVLMELFKVASKLSKLGLEELEAEAGNSESGQSDDSGSNSQPSSDSQSRKPKKK